MSVVVRPKGVVYINDQGQNITAMGIAVTNGDKSGVVNAVGWEITSSMGGAQLVVLGRGPHPHHRLPHRMDAHDEATWMMTRAEIEKELSETAFDITVDLLSARFRPYVTIDGKRTISDEDMALVD